MIEWLKSHWFLFAALVTAGTAWGQNQNRINNLEQRLSTTEQIMQSTVRLDERTQMMQKTMEQQQEMLRELLAVQRSMAQKPPVTQKK